MNKINIILKIIVKTRLKMLGILSLKTKLTQKEIALKIAKHRKKKKNWLYSKQGKGTVNGIDPDMLGMVSVVTHEICRDTGGDWEICKNMAKPYFNGEINFPKGADRYARRLHNPPDMLGEEDLIGDPEFNPFDKKKKK